jgi:hypothetical protein
MNRFKNFTILPLLFSWLVLCPSCEKPIGTAAGRSLIVVDGWIENGQFARVLLTRNTPYFSLIDSGSYLDMVETFAAVSVSDGQEKEYLTLTTDRSLFPWHVYKTTSMKGEVGKTYFLEVQLRDTLLTAQTTILTPPAIDSVWFEPLAENDSLGNLKMMFTHDPEIKEYYRILIKSFADPRFYLIAASTIDDQVFSKPTNNWPLLKGELSQVENLDDLYFKRGERITIKFCAIDGPSFEFWNAFQIGSLNALNPFASSNVELNGNITGEGLGIWSGAGVTYFDFSIE